MGLDRLVVAGGGSGGHVFPALAVADEMRRRGWVVSWLGRHAGIERVIVEDHGVEYQGLVAEAVVGRNLMQRSKALARLSLSAVQARAYLRRLEPQAVLGTGGYVSVPGVLGAALAGKPIVLLEPNSIAGAANRWLSRWASSAAVTDTAIGGELKCPVIETGVPVRREFFSEQPRPTNTGPIRVLVLGGSQGARDLNDLLPRAIELLAFGKAQLKVLHQVGEVLLERAESAYAAHDTGEADVEVVPFVREMQKAMASSDLIVSRAGAVTLAEICAAGRAALLLPIDLAGSHQEANATRLARAGGARVVDSNDLSVETLASALGDLLGDRERLVLMGQANRNLARPEAVDRIADLIEQAAGDG